MSDILEIFWEPTEINLLKVMIYQDLTTYLSWHQSCFKGEQEALAACRYFGVLQVHEMSKPFGWAKRAGTQGAVAWQRTSPTPHPGPREAIPGPSLARMAAAVGLVSPPGGIVLWDEWHATLNNKGSGENPVAPGKTATAAQNPWRRPAKEVRRDPRHK